MPYQERRTNLLPLSYWHEIEDLLFLHGCIYEKHHIDLPQYLPTLPANNLRNSCSLNLQVSKSRTKCFQTSCFIRVFKTVEHFTYIFKRNSYIYTFKRILKTTYTSALQVIYGHQFNMAIDMSTMQYHQELFPTIN